MNRQKNPLFEKLVAGAIYLQQTINLIDNLTPGYKHFLNKMAAQERKILVTLLLFGRTATSKEIAKNCRLDVNTVSATMNRLSKRSLIKKIGEKKPLLYEAIDPFGYTILKRPGIEVYFRIRTAGTNAKEEIKKLLYATGLLPPLQNISKT